MRPNILFISTDQQRRDCYGFRGRGVHTPHLDALAKRGMDFSNCLTPSQDISREQDTKPDWSARHISPLRPLLNRRAARSAPHRPRTSLMIGQVRTWDSGMSNSLFSVSGFLSVPHSSHRTGSTTKGGSSTPLAEKKVMDCGQRRRDRI